MESFKKNNEYGDIEWRNSSGRLHREDGPAVERANGYRAWYINGRLHREGGPAVEYTNRDKYWYINGQFHREDGPAVEYANGVGVWYIDGKYLGHNIPMATIIQTCNGLTWIQSKEYIGPAKSIKKWTKILECQILFAGKKKAKYFYIENP